MLDIPGGASLHAGGLPLRAASVSPPWRRKQLFPCPASLRSESATNPEFRQPRQQQLKAHQLVTGTSCAERMTVRGVQYSRFEKYSTATFNQNGRRGRHLGEPRHSLGCHGPQLVAAQQLSSHRERHLKPRRLASALEIRANAQTESETEAWKSASLRGSAGEVPWPSKSTSGSACHLHRRRRVISNTDTTNQVNSTTSIDPNSARDSNAEHSFAQSISTSFRKWALRP